MDITIIGAGPRGLMTLGRLIAWQTQQTNEPLAVTVVDAYPIGGHVWRTDQPNELIMNTPAQQITLYADDSVKMAGENTVTGPNLSEWSDRAETAAYIRQQHYPQEAFFLAQTAALQPNDYAPRNLYGVYMQWVFDDMMHQLPANMTVSFIQATVDNVTPKNPGYTVTTSEQSWTADQVALTIGHYVMRPTEEEQKFSATAAANGGFYLPPILPGDTDLSAVAAYQPVLMRGVGLSFYDYVSMLTEGRGGVFNRQADGHLTYEPSGQEPHIIAGSRRGFPYYPKGYNQKAYGEQISPVFLTPERMTKMAEESGLSGADFYALLKRDAELTYYSRLIEIKYPDLSVADFASQFSTAADPDAVIEAQGFDPADRLDWKTLVSPLEDLNLDNLQTAIQTRVTAMVEDAKLGTKTGPLTSALEVFRDLRDQVRFAVEHNLFKQDDYLNFLLRWYTPMQDFISVGPPLIRLEQLLALMAAGIVEFMKPEMQVSVVDGQFVARAKDDDHTYTARVLIEARTPGINATNNADPVVESLLASGVATPHQRQLTDGTQYFTHAINLDPKTDQLIDHSGNIVTGLYLFGIPTEGLHWMTTASPRPGVNDGNLITADRIAQQMITGQHDFDNHLLQ
ncbi:FAD(NAD)-dependent oxidoreductase [Secundilactobacillus kimchicus JCM 15530]|uniref:FAD(NAD)-dependent oxidoreductase n=1 Tax=Secundilactobacillus kimchicus JCM 15530 TaxID=1302272 RepID=A0A0R1HWG7_9LACO|nr:FAD/NAD(P)-binding protein [Secundilactobacillus kimchicus]KRK47706.1 FAD(NAD)-dependent oxidoreductase [Secundilactobacillus kimchicus JCM 15530]